MAEVRFHPSAELNWERVGDLYPTDMREGLNPNFAESSICTHEGGRDGSLYLQEIDLLPNADASLHAHDLPEIVYILEGALKFGNRMMDRGSSIFIAAETLYTLKAGDQGCRLLVFMESGLAKFFDKPTFMKRQAEMLAQAAE